jgi:hypothetical protein
MGLSLHYSGSFREGESLSKMIEELKDIMEVFKWDYHIFEKEFPNQPNLENIYDENIYCICLSPPKCEPIFLCFLSNRKMSSPIHLQFYGKTADKEEQKYLYMLSVKTQFAGIEIHKIIIELFRYLEKQGYFSDLKIVDEGEYWETGDEKRLKDIFSKYNNLLDQVSLALESIPTQEGESLEKYFERLMMRIHKRNEERE